MPGAVVCALIGVLIVASGCGSADGGAGSGAAGPEEPASTPEVTAPVATPAVPGMRAQAVRLRTDAAIGGQFQTRITNTGAEPFGVLAVSLDSPGFERLPYVSESATYNPGATIDLPTQYGTAICADGVLVDPAFTAVQIQRLGGVIEEVRVPLEAPDDIVDRIHTEECTAVALAAAVGVSLGVFSAAELDGEPVLQSDLTLTRGDSAEEIGVSELRGSVVFDLSVAEDSDLPVLIADEDELVVPVVLQMTGRGCDAHVLSATQQPFLFLYFLSFDGGEPIYAVLEVSQDQRDALFAYVNVACADA